MGYTGKEIKFEKLLSILSLVFLLGFVLTLYMIFSSQAINSTYLYITSAVLILMFVLSKTASGGIRDNNIFADMLFVFLLLIALASCVVGIVKYVETSTINLFLAVCFVISTFLFIVLLIMWRNSVIERFDLQVLSPTEALNYRALSEVVISDFRPEGYSFDTIVKDFDNYLDHIKKGSTLQVRLVYFALQFIPLIFFNLPLTWMGKQKRVNFIKKRFLNTSGIFRTIFRSAKQLVYFVYYSSKPSFKSTGYVIFEERERFKEMKQIPDPEPLDVTTIKESKEIHTDICVIGSGAAGAVIAYELAKNTGKKVTVLEAGKYFNPQKDYSNMETEMVGKIYKNGGLEMTQDFDLAIMQGICVGGTTTINNGICFRTPNYVFDVWDKLGAKVDVDKIGKCFDRVENIIGAKGLDLNKISKGSSKFYEGADKLGLNPDWFVTNFKDCGGAGYCNLGCKYNRKLSMLLNYLPMAVEHGAEIIADCTAVKFRTGGSKAEKLLCKNSNGDDIIITADKFIISAGAINSSELLLKSGIKKNVGTRVSFNITTPMMAKFPDTLNSFDGIQMCAYVEGDGFLLETVFNPPGTSSLVMQGWFEKLNERMNDYTKFATAAPVVGSEPNGTIKMSLFNKASVDFDLTPKDFRRLKDGMKLLSRVFLTAGAEEVLPASYNDLIIRTDSDCEKIDTEIIKTEDVSMGSAHPQGGNPMSDNKNIGAIDSNFKVHGYSNLYVCDASIFPTGVMVNPQLSIMAMANYAADIIAENG